MSPLQDACNELRQRLNQVETESQVILANLSEFEENAELYLIRRLIKKLSVLNKWILSETKRLYEEHQRKGYVCVLLNERDGLVPYWVEDEKFVPDKARITLNGSSVSSPEEALDFILQQGERLKSNDWPAVVDWLKKYGKSPGLATL